MIRYRVLPENPAWVIAVISRNHRIPTTAMTSTMPSGRWACSRTAAASPEVRRRSARQIENAAPAAIKATVILTRESTLCEAALSSVQYGHLLNEAAPLWGCSA